MAYGLLLLRSAPMLLSTACLQCTYDEYLFYNVFQDVAQTETVPRAQVNSFLQHYVHLAFPRGFAGILVLYPSTWAATTAILSIHKLARFSSLAAAAAASPLSPTARRLYLAGVVLNLAHMFWGPRALDLMETIGRINAKQDDRRAAITLSDAEKDLDNVALGRKWLDLHLWRTFVADVPAFLALTAAFLVTVKR